MGARQMVEPHYAAWALGAVTAASLAGLVRARKRAERAEKSLQELRRHDALGTLAGGIAHDFNNILGSILGFGALLEEDLASQPDTRELARQIMTAARRGQSIVGQLMDYAKKSRRDDRSFRLLSLDAVARESIALLTPSLRKSTKITYSAAATCDAISGNATQIGQVLLNLCINADHAIGAHAGAIDVTLDDVALAEGFGTGGVSVSGEGTPRAPVTVMNGQLPPGRYVRLSVSDNGAGIERDVAARIFDPFFTTKDVSLGTGLGLAAIEGIVHAHGGAIAVESVRHRGTTFRIMLPAIDAPASPAVPPAGKVSP